MTYMHIVARSVSARLSLLRASSGAFRLYPTGDPEKTVIPVVEKDWR